MDASCRYAAFAAADSSQGFIGSPEWARVSRRAATIQGDDGVWTVALGEEIRLPAFVIKLTRDPNRGLTKQAGCIDIDPNWANSAVPLLVFEAKE